MVLHTLEILVDFVSDQYVSGQPLIDRSSDRKSITPERAAEIIKFVKKWNASIRDYYGHEGVIDLTVEISGPKDATGYLEDIIKMDARLVHIDRSNSIIDSAEFNHTGPRKQVQERFPSAFRRILRGDIKPEEEKVLEEIFHDAAKKSHRNFAAWLVSML